MNYSRLIVLALALALSCLGTRAYGAALFLGTFVELDANGTDTLYDIDEFGTDVTDFHGANLGTFAQGDTLKLNAVQVLTSEDGDDDITGGSVSYRVVPDGQAGDSFSGFDLLSPGTVSTAINGSAVSGAGNEVYGHPNLLLKNGIGPPNFLENRPDGTYQLEVFFRAYRFSVDTGSPLDAISSAIANGGGSNPTGYTASFTVTSVPEPAVALLAGLGGLVLTGFRRKREAE